MKILVISDIHGNLPALEKVLKIERDYDLIVSLGDLVNYGPWSNECVEMIDSLENCISIQGNHDEYFINGNCPVYHPLVKLFYEQTYPEFIKFDLLKKTILSWQFEDWNFCHTIEGKRIFHDTVVNAPGKNFIGHSHSQFIRFSKEDVLCNAGSVGQNRTFVNICDYALFYPETSSIQLKSIPYDVEFLISEMKSRKFPKECIDYYQNKAQV